MLSESSQPVIDDVNQLIPETRAQIEEGPPSHSAFVLLCIDASSFDKHG